MSQQRSCSAMQSDRALPLCTSSERLDIQSRLLSFLFPVPLLFLSLTRILKLADTNLRSCPLSSFDSRLDLAVRPSACAPPKRHCCGCALKGWITLLKSCCSRCQQQRKTFTASVALQHTTCKRCNRCSTSWEHPLQTSQVWHCLTHCVPRASSAMGQLHASRRRGSNPAHKNIFSCIVEC